MVLDLRSRGCSVKPHQRHCVCPCPLESHFTLRLVLVQPRKFVDWNVKQQWDKIGRSTL